MKKDYRSRLLLGPAACLVLAPSFGYCHPRASLVAHKPGYFSIPDAGHDPELPESDFSPEFSVSSISAYASGGATGAFAISPSANAASGGATGWYSPQQKL